MKWFAIVVLVIAIAAAIASVVPFSFGHAEDGRPPVFDVRSAASAASPFKNPNLKPVLLIDA